jgi:hypothetical protein
MTVSGKRPDELEDDMKAIFSKCRGNAWIWGMAVILLALPVLSVNSAAGQEPAKKYEKYLGKYEFDLSAMGGGTRVFEFYVKDGAFWIEYGFTSPGELKPTEGVADQFTFTDPDDGLSKLTFQKDGAGEYTKVRLVCESINLDVVGAKQK